MGDNKKIVERRKHERFTCTNCAVTVNFKACPIVNISMGGFAFRYSNSGDWQQDNVKGAILFGDNLYLEEVPFQTVFDSVVQDSVPDLIENRQRGVRFGKLTPDQEASLQDYISHLADEVV